MTENQGVVSFPSAVSSDPVKKLKRRRATVKAKITNQLTLINEDSSTENVTNCKAIIEELLIEIKTYDSEICDLVSGQCSDEDIPADVASELGKQSSYLTSIRNKLSSLVFAESKVSSVTGADCKVKLPEIKLESFTGEGTSHLEYHSFITQFKNLVASRSNLSNSTKLTYPKSYLKGYANKLIQHLQVTESNFGVALDILNSEFLNVDSLVEDLLKKLLELKPQSDPTYLKTKIFLGDIRCIVSDLKIYDFDFMNEPSGSKLLSHI